MKPFMRSFYRSRQAAADFTRVVFDEYRCADQCMEVAFYRMIAVFMLLLAPMIGLIFMMLGMMFFTGKGIFNLLKTAFNKMHPPNVNRSSDHG